MGLVNINLPLEISSDLRKTYTALQYIIFRGFNSINLMQIYLNIISIKTYFPISKLYIIIHISTTI